MNFTPLINAPLILKMHIIVSICAIIFGAWQFFTKKGTFSHKVSGWAWVFCMIAIVFSAFLLPRRPEGLIPITIAITIWVLIGLPCAIIAIKRGNIMLHRAFMIGLYAGGLIMALTFTMTPGRLFFRMLFE